MFRVAYSRGHQPDGQCQIPVFLRNGLSPHFPEGRVALQQSRYSGKFLRTLTGTRLFEKNLDQQEARFKKNRRML